MIMKKRKKGDIGKIKAFFSSFLFCLNLSWKSSNFYTIARLLCGIITPMCTLISTYVGKDIVNLLAGEGKESNKTFLLQLLLTLFLTGVGISANQKLQQYLQTVHNEILTSHLSLYVIKKAVSLDLEYYDNPEYYDKLTAADRDSNAITYLLWNVISGVSYLITCIAAFLILSNTNWLYGIVILATAIPSSIAAARYTKTLYHLSLEQMNQEREKDYIKSVSVDQHHAKEIRLFQAGKFLLDTYKTLWEKVFVDRKRMIKSRSISTGLLDCIPQLVVILIEGNIAFQILDGHATVGDYVFYTGLIGQLWGAISMLSTNIVQIYDNQMRIQNFRSLEHVKNKLKDTGTCKLDKIETIEFEHIHFTYPGTNREVLSEVNFQISKGEKIALVGLNGSGKSTLIKLLLRYYDPDQGRIKINGIDLKEYQLEEVRRNFSVYFQDEANFSLSLWDNLTIADNTPRQNLDQEIKKAYLQAGCEDILKKATNGLEHYLTRIFQNDGLELSGGQFQKVAIARAFFRKHTALIMDEPSSSLDPMAEHKLFEVLKDFSKGKTTIFTSHRLSNVNLADRIIVLEYGKVIEIGTQEELLQNPKRYAELFQYQKEKFDVNCTDR